MKEERFIEGLKALRDGHQEYVYEYKEKITYNCRIQQWRKEEFNAWFPQINLAEIVEDFSSVLRLPSELLGKRSNQIAVSASRKFCLKLIDEESLKKFDQIFQQTMKFREDKETCQLIDIYGVYIIEAEEKNFKYNDIFILMPSVRGNVDDILFVYDIKGYTEGRSLSPSQCEDFKFGKDENFLNSKQLQIVQEIQESENKFVENLIKNIEFLQKHELIDYSLLMSFEIYKPQNPQPLVKSRVSKSGILIKWGIIDYFQEYNSKKKAENKFKSFFKKQYSSVEPEIYSKRFISFIQKYFE